MNVPTASLRARLLWSVGLATLAVWSIAVGVSYLGARHEAIELLDGQLAQSARLLLSQARHEWTGPGEEDTYSSDADEDNVEEWAMFHESAPNHEYEQPLEFHIWTLTGEGVWQSALRSAHAPELKMPGRMGYATIEHDGQEWRTLTHRDETEKFQVQVAQPTGNRTRAALEVAMRVSVPFVIALPLLMLLLFLAVGRGLAPLDRLAQDVGRRAPEALEPLPTDGLPREILPLLNALNALLERLRRALDNERRFTADAAHELRTPLAALKVQAQVAQLAQDAATRDHALAQVGQGVDRATRLVEQLLRLARLDPMQLAPGAKPLNLAPILESVAASLRAEAEARGARLGIHADASLQVAADGELLAMALRNLLENALRHGPSPGEVELGADQLREGGARRLRIWIRDSGPGVAEDELARLTDRFYRGRDAQVEGTGLGLAIARRIAQLHGGVLTLANRPEGGFQATLSLPAPGTE